MPKNNNKNFAEKQNLENEQVQDNFSQIPELSNKEKLQNSINKKYEEWRKIQNVLPEKNKEEIEQIIQGIDSEMQKLLADENETLTDSELQDFDLELNTIGQNIENQILENKNEILSNVEAEYSKNVEQFEKNLEKSKKKLKSNFINSLPTENLNTVIDKDRKVIDIIATEIDANLEGLGTEIHQIPSLIEKTKSETKINQIISNLEDLNKNKKTINLSPDEYVNSLYNWNENAEASSAIIADLNEYIIAIDFFFSDKSIEEKVGLNIPKDQNYKETNDLIKERQRQMMDRFSKDAKFVKKYKKAPVYDLSNLKLSWENEIMSQYIADTLNKDGIKFSVGDKKKEYSYDKDTILMLTNFEHRKKFKSHKNLLGSKDRSEELAYNQMQNDFYEKVLNHPELKDKIRLNIKAEQSGDKLKVSVDDSFIFTSINLQKVNYLNDPRLLKYKDQIDEIAGMKFEYDNNKKELQQKKIEFTKKYRDDLIAPEGLGNLLYGARRLFKSFGENPEKLLELQKNNTLTYELINHDKTKKGSKYKEGKAFLMSTKTFTNRAKINSNKGALINGTGDLTSNKISQTSTTENIEEDNNKLSDKTLVDKFWEIGEEYVPGLIDKIETAYNNYTDIKAKNDENLNASQVLEDIPDNQEIDEELFDNLEKRNGGKLSKEDQKLLATKKVDPFLLAKITTEKYYEEAELGAKFLTESLDKVLTNENSSILFYLKNVYKAEPYPQGESENKEKTQEKLQIPQLKNPKSIRFIAENIESMKTPSTIGILKVYLNTDLQVDSTPDEKKLYKLVYESIYNEEIANPGLNGAEIFLKYMISKETKNIMMFEEKDLEMMEFFNEKRPKLTNKYLQTWLQRYGNEDINKDLFKENIDLNDELVRKKAIRIISILEKCPSPETKLLKSNITKSINEKLGLSEDYKENMYELADIALEITLPENNNQQKIAIQAFTKGIYKDENPKESEISKQEFDKRIKVKEFELNAKILV